MKNRDYSKVYRILHWSIAFCMLFMILTIFLRLTWMNRDAMSTIVSDYMSEAGKGISEEDATSIARKIRKPMWMWHIYIGYVLVGLYMIRLVLPLFGEMKFPNPFRSELSGKEKFQSWVYLVFYLCLAGSLSTGLLIEFGSDSIHELMEEIHVLSIYYVIAFIVLHFGGVLIAELTDQQGIVSRIISGKRKE